jgi:DNA-binding LacI/PurR family transcriptional regulator
VAATMSDVARLAGVSKKTVSNFFNGYPYMRDETRRRIEKAIDELNYKVNISARNLRSGRTGTIGLAIPELAHPYFAELSQSVVSAAQARGLNVLVEVTEGDRDQEVQILRGARGRSVDGLIFGPIALDPADVDGATVDIPLVLIGDRVHEGLFDFVTVANTSGAHAATSHLLESGRRRVVALGVDDASAPTAAAQRRAGYLRAHEEHGVSPDPALMVGPLPWHRPPGAAATAQLLDAGIGFDAIFGFNEALALGALRELRRRGISVPEDVAVVGFDDVEEAQFSSPSLTTVDSGRDWIARKAVELLDHRIGEAGDTRPPQVWVADHKLIRRESSS